MSKRLGGIIDRLQRQNLFIHGIESGFPMVVTLLGQQYPVGAKPTVIRYTYYINRYAETPNKTKTEDTMSLDYSSVCNIGSRVVYEGNSFVLFLKRNQNAPRPSEHPPVRGEKMTFRWDHRLQIQNLFMAFERVLRWK